MPTRRCSSVRRIPYKSQCCISPRPSHSVSCRTMNRRLCGLSGLKLLPPNFSSRGGFVVRCWRSPVERTRRTQLCRGIWRTTKLPSGPCPNGVLDGPAPHCSPGVRAILCGARILEMAFGKLGCRSKQGRLLGRRADRNSCSLHVCYGSFASVWPDHSDFRSTHVNGHSQDRRACLKGAMNGLMHRGKNGFYPPRRYGSIWLRWSFGQPGLPQSFFQSREVFGAPIRAQQVFESGNTQLGTELPQPSHCLVCLLRPSGHCVACGIDA